MLTLPLPDPNHQAATLPAGTVLLRRARHDDHIHHLAEGRVALGLLGPDGLAHTLGWLEGPCWLDPGSAVLGQARISLRELVQLSPGDVIPIDAPEAVLLLAENVPLYHGRFGVSQGHNAVKILSGAAT